MQKADLYSRSSGLQRTDAKYVLEKYLPLMGCRADGVYMDVGCGSGDVTLETLLPLLPSGFNRLIGTDLSEAMVQASIRKNADDRIVFKTCNIADKTTLEEFRGKIDHIFSFFCLHWIQDQRAAYQNVHDMLRGGGDVLAVYLADNPIYEIYAALAGRERWAGHMRQWRRFCSPFHRCEGAQARLERVLASVGLKARLCTVETRAYTYPSMDVLRKSVLAVLPVPFIKQMQEAEIDEFIDDYVSLARKTRDVIVTPCNNNNEEEEVTLRYKIVVVCASRPL